MFPSLLSSPLPPPYSDVGKTRVQEKRKVTVEVQVRDTPKNKEATTTAAATTTKDTKVEKRNDKDLRCDGVCDRDCERDRQRSSRRRGNDTSETDDDRANTRHRGRSRSRSVSYRSEVERSGRDAGERRNTRRQAYRDSDTARDRDRSPSPDPAPAPRTPRTHLATPSASRTPSPPGTRSRWSPRFPRFSGAWTPPTPALSERTLVASSSATNLAATNTCAVSFYTSSPTTPATTTRTTYTFSSKSTVTQLFLASCYKYIVPHLPEDLQAIARDPPDLSRPETLVVLFRAVAPYTHFLLILVLTYVIWALVSGFVLYMSRFMRFCFRIGPVVAIVAWIMAANGQGGIDVLFEALKQYAGLAPTDPHHPKSAGWDSTPATPSHSNARPRRHHRRDSTSHSDDLHSDHSDSDSDAYWDDEPRKNSSRSGGSGRRGQQADPALVQSLFEEGLGPTVQGYVKTAIVRAAGLEWLVGGAAAPRNDVKENRRERSDRRTDRREDRERERARDREERDRERSRYTR